MGDDTRAYCGLVRGSERRRKGGKEGRKVVRLLLVFFLSFFMFDCSLVCQRIPCFLVYSCCPFILFFIFFSSDKPLWSMDVFLFFVRIIKLPVIEPRLFSFFKVM